MQRGGEIDIILDILKAGMKERPDSGFIKSLYNQYCERGNLSKKQLEGLYSKTEKLSNIPHGKLATLEAIIKKKPGKYKSPLPELKTFEPDNTIPQMVETILLKYPSHKRVIFFKVKLGNNELLNNTEKSELEKFYKLLIK